MGIRGGVGVIFKASLGFYAVDICCLVLHSHAYRCPEPFADKTVVVLGAGPSGIDIALEVSSVAKLVILSHGNPPLKGSMPHNLLQATTILNCSSTSITFHDGSVHPADAFIYCTGYNYRFPFLRQGLGMQTDGAALPPLYRHLMHPSFHTLFFIGLCTTVCPFILFHCQIRYCLAVLEGKCRLPLQAIMESKVKEEYECYLATGQKPKHFPRLASKQWGYFLQLAEEAGFPHIPPVIQKVYDAVRSRRIVEVEKYKDINLRLLSDEDWEIVDG